MDINLIDVLIVVSIIAVHIEIDQMYNRLTQMRRMSVWTVGPTKPYLLGQPRVGHADEQRFMMFFRTRLMDFRFVAMLGGRQVHVMWLKLSHSTHFRQHPTDRCFS